LKLDSRVGGLLWDYLILIFKISKNSEKSLHYVINPNFIAYQPIEDIIHRIPVHTTVLYGDKDWMCSKGAKRVNNKNLKNFKLVFINDCGHQMTMENPEALAEHFTSKISIIEQYETSK
jgi:cardiolipin-specific phospholipase